jgi:hypothetical protein
MCLSVSLDQSITTCKICVIAVIGSSCLAYAIIPSGILNNFLRIVGRPDTDCQMKLPC